jgi:hypothetical protein
MNKRKAKKHKKKMELFAISFVSSYKELKAIDRSYYEYVLMCKRKEKLGYTFAINEELL